MNATVYFLTEDNKTFQFSCHGREPYMFHQPNVNPGPQSAQQGGTQDTNSLMSNRNVTATTSAECTHSEVVSGSLSQRQTQLAFVCVEGKLSLIDSFKYWHTVLVINLLYLFMFLFWGGCILNFVGKWANPRVPFLVSNTFFRLLVNSQLFFSVQPSVKVIVRSNTFLMQN